MRMNHTRGVEIGMQLRLTDGLAGRLAKKTEAVKEGTGRRQLTALSGM